jgi:beta-lactamase superfamily II metal-dependent hydrolase
MQCVVLFGVFDGVRVLLLSDLGKPAQNVLLERYPELVADIVVSGIPARSEPLAEALLERAGPKIIVITDAEYPATQRASRALRERLMRRGVPVLFTRETGAVYLSLRGGRGELRTMSGLTFSLPPRENVFPLPSNENENGTDQSTE